MNHGENAVWRKIGHRGAPHEFPANTMKSFSRAVELGCDIVECDVRQAADGVLVLAHDPDVVDRQGRRYQIETETSAGLAALDMGMGEGIPSLVELVAWANGRCGVMADLKCEGNGIEEKLVSALAPLPLEAKIVPGASESSRCLLRELDATLPLSLTVDTNYGHLLNVPDLAERVAALYADAVTWEHPLLTAERIAALHARGLPAYAWTVDAPDIMYRLLAEGVDGIISNRPDLLCRL